MAQQQSRKQLLKEPDEFLSASQHIWTWVTEHRSRAGAIAGAAVGVLLLAVVTKALIERSRVKRDEAVSTAVARLGQVTTGAPPADLVSEFGQLAKKYDSAPAGQVARYLEAGALGAGGDADKARQAYEQVRGKSAKGDLGSLAGVALAYLELSQGRDDAALTAFQALLEDKESVLPRAQIMMEIAGIEEKRGKSAAALEAYRDVLAKYPDGSWAADAKTRVQALSGKGTPAS
ncbi:MAG TPA: tetratricopeptide repeat protein [bacterium]